MNGSNLITVSRLKCLQACPRKHYYAYEVGLRSEGEQRALRFGRIYHVALDTYARERNFEQACEAIYSNYDHKPDYIESFDWSVERETVLRLFAGYVWLYENDGIEVIESEKVFQLPILNPETGRPTPLFERSGKIDKKIRFNGRTGIMEHKTTRDSIEPDSDYWHILRLDIQVSMYFDVSDVDFILYDVTRKPGIEPKQVPVLDDMRFKIVLDANGNRVFKKGGLPRESGDKEKGYVLQTRVETAEEFSARLAEDIKSRPEFYYARREIARTADDLAEFRQDLWDEQQALRARQKRNAWTRRPSQGTCDYCEFKNPCFNNAYPIGDDIPAGFVRVGNVNPELELSNNVNASTDESTVCASTTA